MRDWYAYSNLEQRHNYLNYETKSLMPWCHKYTQRCGLFSAHGIYHIIKLEDQRIGLCQSSSIDFAQVFHQIDTKGVGKVYPVDLIKFLSVHRIAISERESEYLVYLSGAQNPYMDFDKYCQYYN